MIRGLRETESRLRGRNIPFFLLNGEPGPELAAFARREKAGLLVSDFDPLNVKRQWKQDAALSIGVPFCEVDAHNIVPCWTASAKQEFAARTIRPKIERLLPEFLVEFSRLRRHPFSHKGPYPQNRWEDAEKAARSASGPGEVSWIRPGSSSGHQRLRSFLRRKIGSYARDRNEPSVDGQSGLSSFLHFGHISAQRVALEVRDRDGAGRSEEAFLDELIIRRELSDNFCFYNRSYDSVEGFPPWAIRTLLQHRKDRRAYLYDEEQLEKARTHDPLWNAAQREMTETGKMHGYMRMYWCKKILEWSETPEAAMRAAIALNDRYELDGRDPNGYAGIAWSIGGVHDRPWPERKVFGKVRYMSYNSCLRKFDAETYMKRHTG
jgi:deoxyribodipyrimidine photo-lyase